MRLYRAFVKKLVKRLPSSVQKMITRDTCGGKSDTRTARGSVSYSIISNLRQLPLTAFIACSVNKEYDLLGSAPADVLETAWQKLLSLYYEAKGDKHTKKYVELAGEMAAIELRQQMIAVMCERMRIYPTRRGRLNFAELGYPFAFTPESMEQDLTIITNKEKVHDIRLKQLRAEFKQFQSKNDDGKTNVEGSFYDNVAAMNEAWKTSYSVDKMSTMEYCIYSKRYESYIENLQK